MNEPYHLSLLKNSLDQLSQVRDQLKASAGENGNQTRIGVELISQATEVLGEVEHQITNFSDDQTSKIARLTEELVQKQKELDLVNERFSKLKTILTKVDNTSIPSLQEMISRKQPTLSNKANQIQATLLGARLYEDIKLRRTLTLRKIKIRVEEIADHREEQLIGVSDTRIAFKNPNSYLITSSQQGMKLVEGNWTLYLGNLPMDRQRVRSVDEVIYVESLNCYFIQMPYKLFRKNIDSAEPFFYMNLECGSFGNGMIYSKKNRRLICVQYSELMIVNLSTKEIEKKVKCLYGMMDLFQLLGKYRVFAVGKTDHNRTKGFICLCKINCETLTADFFRKIEFDLPQAQGQYESYEALEVCDKDRYCFLSLNSSIDRSYCLSRIIIFYTLKDDLTLKLNVELLDQKITPNWCLKFGGYAKKRMLLLAISQKRKIKLFCYNTIKREFGEIEEKRVDSGEYDVRRIERIGDDFYYLGNGARVMKLSITG